MVMVVTTICYTCPSPLQQCLQLGIGISLLLKSSPPLFCRQLYVHLHLVLDGLGSVPEHQRCLGLCLIEGAGGAADDESGPSIATQALLKDTSQFAVTIRNVGFLERERAVDNTR